MDKFPTIENFLENAFEYEDLNELLRYLKEIGNGCHNKPLNICGERGCGKTAFGVLLKNIFDSAVIIDSHRFLSHFNGLWAEKDLVIIDEPKLDDNVVDKIIKTYYSDNIEVNMKGKLPKLVFNDITFIMFTNIPLLNDNINLIRMNHPVSYNKMLTEASAFKEYCKNLKL